MPDLHPLVVDAAGGRLPDWAVVKDSRRSHLASVADLLDRWADELGLDERQRTRWRAAGWLHDALRDADASELAAEASDLPEAFRHGPAAAARLEEAGVGDEELVEAIRYHSVGKRALGRLGRFLYLADYLDPERSFGRAERAALRARLPGEGADVLKAVCARRIARALDRRFALRPETVEFWNDLLRAE